MRAQCPSYPQRTAGGELLGIQLRLRNHAWAAEKRSARDGNLRSVEAACMVHVLASQGCAGVSRHSVRGMLLSGFRSFVVLGCTNPVSLRRETVEIKSILSIKE